MKPGNVGVKPGWDQSENIGMEPRQGKRALEP